MSVVCGIDRQSPVMTGEPGAATSKYFLLF